MSTMNITEVRLMRVPLENDYQHTFYFESEEKQTEYFLGLVANSKDDFSYQRKEGFIRWPDVYDNISSYNYLMFRNTDFYPKWYYAFIKDIKYISEGKSDIYFEIDVMQTYMFDYTLKHSFVEREHAYNDAIGAHTFPEGLETGEYIANGTPKQDIISASGIAVIFAVTESPDGTRAAGNDYGGVFSGIGYRPALPKDGTAADNAIGIVNAYASAGKADSIQSVFLAPTALFSLGDNGAYINQSADAESWDIDLGSVPATIDGYTPRNKKLLTYPYSYLYLTNQQGGAAIYHNEKFYTGTRKFTTYGVVCPGCSIRTIPLNYNNIEKNTDEGLNLGKYPVCSWAGDAYTNWITQNGLNMNIGVGSAAVSGGAGLIGGGIAAAMAGTPLGVAAGVGTALLSGLNALTQIGQVVAEKRQHQMQPDQASGNINCGDVVYSAGQNNFKWIDMSIKAEYARIIDDYFDMFGYQINRLKTPEMGHRKNWWYTKTISVNIDKKSSSEVSNIELQKIKDCYNRGITFWRNPENIGNYSVDNSIV